MSAFIRRWPWHWRVPAPWWLAAAAMLSLGWALPQWHERLDLCAYDLLAPALKTPPRTVVIAIDDASLAALGRWPWSRDMHARLLDRLREAGAARVAFAILFIDAADDEGDGRFAVALARFPGAVLAAAPEPDSDADWSLEAAPAAPLPSFMAHAVPGHARVPLDSDGVARRTQPMALSPDGMSWPALAVAALGRADLPQKLPGGPRLASPPALVLLPKPGQGAYAVPQLSFVQALADPDLAAKVEGRTVFVGVTAAGIDQPLITSEWQRGRALSAVAFHAHAYETLRQQAQIVAWPATGQALADVLLVTLPLACLALCRRWAAWLWPLALAAPWLAAVAVLAQGRWMSPVLATLALVVAGAFWLVRDGWRAHRDHRRSQQKAQATLQAIGDAVIVVRADHAIDHVNRSAQQLARGLVLPGQSLEQAFAFDVASMARLRNALGAVGNGLQSAQLPEPLTIGIGAGRRALRATVSPMRDRRGRPDGVVVALSDVTDALATAARLAHAASHDTLTHLPNRMVLADRLNAALGVPSHEPVALLFVDLDRFKRINDSLGHHHGDEVLRVTATRLRAACRPFDTVARWGGDEFVVLAPGLRGRDEAADLAEAIVAALGEDIDLDGLRVPSSCSVGVALAPENGHDLDTLIAMADAAMYDAKAQPGTGWRFCNAMVGKWTRDRLSLEADIRGALEKGQFELHFQPQVATRSGRLVGFEALLRWRHDSGRIIMPNEFVGVAEESGLILTLGHWVLREAVRVIAHWQAHGGPQVPVAVNVSVQQCLDRSLVDSLRETLALSGIPPHLLTLEITETAAMKDAAQVHALLTEIHALGVRLALDDFGTGYSSLAYLKRFPIDEIKIDRSFVRDIEADRDNAAIVRATIALAHSLGLPAVAEGVETEGQRRRLQQLRCDKLQGFLFSAAMRAEDAAHWHWPLQAEPTQSDLWMVDTGAFRTGRDTPAADDQAVSTQ